MGWHVASDGLGPLGRYLRHSPLSAWFVEKVRLRTKLNAKYVRAAGAAREQPLEASELDRLLWAGFATYAVEELKAS